MKFAVRAALPAALLLSVALAQTPATPSVTTIISNVNAAQKTVKDLSFRLSGSSAVEGNTQNIDLTVQSIPAQTLARVVFAAPDSLADNIVVVDKAQIRNYLYLTNQITVTSTAKATSQSGFTGLDFTQLSNFSALLKNYDVKVVSTTGTAGTRVYGLEGTPKAASTNDGRARIYITEAGWRPTRIQLLDGSGRTTADLAVSNYKTNAGLSAARLRMLPADAEVIRQ